MTRLPTSVVFAVSLIVMAAESFSAAAQAAKPAATPASKSATMSLSIAVPVDHIPLGQKPWVALTVKNLGNQEIAYPRDRLHVEGPKGEPPTTYLQRSITNRLKPGEPQILPTGFQPRIAPRDWPGDTFTMKYDLSAFYDFKDPGKYTVYIEVFDRLSEKVGTTNDTDNWLRSPVATFELQPPAR